MPRTAADFCAAGLEKGETVVDIIRTDAQAIDTARRLAEKFRQGAAERDRQRLLPWEAIEQITQAGLFGISVPRQYGGAQVSAATIAEVFRLLSAADPSIGQIPQNHFCWLPIVDLGTPAQARFFHERVLRGERIGNAHSEDTRKRPGDYVHELTREAGGYRITGRKYYSTGAIFAQWIPFIGDDAQQRKIMLFVDATDPGVTVIDDWDGMGQRTTASGTTVFDGAFVPDDRVFPMHLASQAQRPFGPLASLIHAAIDLGIAEEVLDDAGRYIREQCRPWTANPEATHAEEPFVVQTFGEYSLKLRTAQVMQRHAAQLVDKLWAEPGEQALLEARLAVADARLVCGQAALDISHEFFSITGARAALGKFALDRHWRNARTHSLHDPFRWKLYHLGNYHLNGVVPPAGSYI